MDLDYHLRRVQVPAPGGRRELDQVIGEIASTPLDRSRPLWEFHFAEGMADDRFALIGKVHHTLADGVASANLLARLMDLAGSAQDERDDYVTCDPPSRRQLLWEAQLDHVQNMAALPRLISDAARGVARVRRRTKERPRPPRHGENLSRRRRLFSIMWFLRSGHSRRPRCRWPKSKKPQSISASRSMTSCWRWPRADLRELLLRYDGRADRPIIATVPVSTDKSAERITGNEISGMTVSLPVHIDDPLERVDLTSLATKRAKEDHDLLGPELQGRMMEYLPPPLAPAMFRRQSKRAAHNRLMNVAVSNVPGPRERGHIGGAPVSEIYSVGVLSAGSAFNMTVWSYVDQLDIAVLSDDHTFKDPHEATDAMIHAFGEIRRACGLAELTTVGTAMAPATAGG